MSFEELEELKIKKESKIEELNIDENMLKHIDLDKTPKKQYSVQ